MMGIYIKGINMPKDGERPCWAVIHYDGRVEYNENKDLGWQPSEAVAVPDHGRLIDADVLVKENAMAWGTEDIIRIAKAPTIRVTSRPQTNADRIRAMTDEELAEFFTGTDMCELLCGPGPRYCKSRCDEKCLEWLKNEANNG